MPRPTSSPLPRLAYLHSTAYADLASFLPSNIGRAKRVHALIEAYGFLALPELTIVSPRRATLKELCRYHSRDYIDFLRQVENDPSDDDEADDSEDDDHKSNSHTHTKQDRLEEYGLRYDCPVFEGIAQYAEFVAGSTIEAAMLLNDDAFDIVIHWDGGRHHAKKDMAAGFCIVNDITHDKVMYIDLDIHHGDGVENAFQLTDRVLTMSLHHYAKGFYPGTGDGTISSTRTKAIVNVPLKSGLSDSTLVQIFNEMVEPVYAVYKPNSIVLQCGVDGMTGDPLGKWNLTMEGYGECLKKVLSWNKPLMILGGGGYKSTSAARCYAYLTSLILKRPISDEIPEHEFFEDYKPDFMLSIDPGRQVDENTDTYLQEVRKLIGEQSQAL
ncbi:MAG: hypothetical protein J3Q66DRAFT_377616 [Benniella sp.]|nr:MAG: hypothetical protein J3Q66DRAFT_377616 [Benniella sp.]